MIGRLSGMVDYKGSDHVLIDVRGVGYVVHVSDRVLARLPAEGEAVALYTDLVVRQDMMQLIGFLTLTEKEWHRLLVGVQGVGVKASLSILGTLGADGLSRAIALGDWNAVARAKGVGPKTAQRVVLDLKDRAPSVMAMAGRAAMEGEGSTELIEESTATPRRKRAAAADPSATSAADALSALMNLGYGPSDAAAAVAETQGEAPDADTQTLIRLSLKRLAPR